MEQDMFSRCCPAHIRSPATVEKFPTSPRLLYDPIKELSTGTEFHDQVDLVWEKKTGSSINWI